MNSSYAALICRVLEVRPIDGADKIQVASVAGYNVIVGKDVVVGQIGIFYGPDGALSRKHLLANKLYKKHPDTGELMGGMFEENGRVRSIKLRGQISEGFWHPIRCVEWTGVDISKLKDGDTFTELNGHKICQKYYSPAAVRMMNSEKNKGQSALRYKLSEKYSAFKQHFETEQLRGHLKDIPKDSIITITCKCHGTSGRTGHIVSNREGAISDAIIYASRIVDSKKFSGALSILPREKRIFVRNNIIKLFKKTHEYITEREKRLYGITNLQPKRLFDYVSGTRRTILDVTSDTESGFYSGKKFRINIHNTFKSLNIPKNITIFYEIVGFSEDGGYIMPPHDIEDKEIKKLYGNKMIYAYGCNRDNPLECYKVLVYRITMTNDDGFPVEFSWPAVEDFCSRYGLKTVPVLYGPFIYDGNTNNLLDICRSLSDGPDPQDPTHTREGVCIRIEHKNLTTIYKWKGRVFSLLENISHSDEHFVDPEDVS